MIPLKPQTVVELTQNLIRIPSGPGQEQEIARYLLKILPTFGFDPIELDEFGSVTGVVSGNNFGPTLLMDAHTDTVGVAPGIPWTHDPYGGDLDEDRLYGRGASDMKGALAAMIVACGAVNRADLAGQLILSASVMEEVLEGAALEPIMERYQPDFVIIGEASDLKIIHGGRGRAEIRIETLGKPAHSSSPASGINAVDAVLPVLSRLQAIELPRHPFVGQAIFAVTDIISEPYPGHSVLPSRCRVTVDRRLIPGETPEGVLEPLRRLPTIPGAQLKISIATGDYQTWTDHSLHRDKWFPAWTLDPAHPLIQGAIAGLEKIGLQANFGAYNFCTNAAYSAGIAGVPTIGFGPSQEEMAHIADEYIQVEALIKAAQAYKAMIETLLSN